MMIEMYVNGAGKGALKNPVGKKLPPAKGNRRSSIKNGERCCMVDTIGGLSVIPVVGCLASGRVVNPGRCGTNLFQQ